jgi:membrane protein YdbS with pleckstrin-like domain
MSKLDKTKEKINSLKYWLGVLIGAFAALSTWLFNSVETAPIWQVAVVSILLALFTLLIVKLNAKMHVWIDDLENL